MFNWIKNFWNKIFGDTILGTYLDSPSIKKKKRKRKKKKPIQKSHFTIINDNETNPLDVDLVDDNISNKDKKELRTFTKKWVDRILTISLFDIQLCFVLAFMGKENIAESLGIAMATEIVGTIAGYYAKSFFETYSEKKNDIEMEKIHKDYETITPNADDDNTNAFG